MKSKSAGFLLVFALAPLARGGAVYVMAESFNPTYSALDMDMDMSVEDSFTNPYFNQVQQDSATYTGSWYFTRTRIGVHQFDINTGASIVSLDAHAGGIAITGVEFSVPLYVRYNYNLALRHNLFLYGGVLAGGVGASSTVDLNVPGVFRKKSSVTTVSGLAGVGVGLKYFGADWGFDLGYDFRVVGSDEGSLDTTGALVPNVNYTLEHVVSLRVVLRF